MQPTGSSSFFANARRRRRVCSCRVIVSEAIAGPLSSPLKWPGCAEPATSSGFLSIPQAGHSFDRRPVPTCLMPAARPRRCLGQGAGAGSTTEWTADCRTSRVQFSNLFSALYPAADPGYSESLTTPVSYLFVVMPPRNLSLSLRL